MSSVASPRQDTESRSPRSETLRLTGRAGSPSAQSAGAAAQYSRHLRKLSPPCVTACRHSETMINSESTSIMDMRYACIMMACQNGCSADSYFTTYQPLLVLPIRASDAEAGGSGAAEAWAVPSRRVGRVPRQRISAGGDIMPLHQKE